MIAVQKLMTLTPLHRARKAAQTLGHIEEEYRYACTDSARWISELGEAFSKDDFLPENLRQLAYELTKPESKIILNDKQNIENAVRLINRFARSLEAFAGLSPADWDFRLPIGLVPSNGLEKTDESLALPGSRGLDKNARHVFPGVRVYLDDLRSPFNVGAVFRSSDAFGVKEVLLSDFTADPDYPRAKRSAMGATDIVPWRRAKLDELSSLGTIFALELRGENIDEFEFPEQGVVIVGSEELGVSPEAMALCTKTVSIPICGAKGSLNASVAFGILMNAWRANLTKRGIVPQNLN